MWGGVTRTSHESRVTARFLQGMEGGWGAAGWRFACERGGGQPLEAMHAGESL